MSLTDSELIVLALFFVDKMKNCSELGSFVVT